MRWGVLFAFIFLLLLLEHWFPLRRPTTSKLRRIGVNLSLSLFTLGMAALIVWPATDWAMRGSSFGIVPLLSGLSAPAALALSFLLLDLSFYYWHRLNHTSRWLWRFHNVHHIDPDLDVTTAFRFHFGEVLVSTLFRVGQVVLIGPTIVELMAYDTVFRLATHFHHSNIRLPEAVDRSLQWLFVTPRMHSLHHSQAFAETHSNFSVVFSCWDKLHRTFTERASSAASPLIGVPAYRKPIDNQLVAVLKLPFLKQRDYWESGQSLTPVPFLPNALTLFRVLFIPLDLALLARGHFEWAWALLLFASLTDYFDGKLARALNQTSSFGALMDPVADKALILTFTTYLWSQGILPAWAWIPLLTRNVLQLLSIPILLWWKRIVFKVVPKFVPKFASGFSYGLVLFGVLLKSSKFSSFGVESTIFLAACGLSVVMELYILWGYVPRFVQIYRRTHDTFE